MSRPNRANEGIQATNVTADVLAVGRNARAGKNTTGSSQELDKAVAEFERAIQALNLTPAVKAEAAEGAAGLRGDVQRADTGPHTERLQRIVNGLKSAGVVLSQTASLAEPLTKIAGLLRVPLHLLGL
ncbi:MAG: hypothetical protein KGN84_19460 [Acidobacteriota bacterium]|nr:hypothetical protein [Acidobacteriota bacterium]